MTMVMIVVVVTDVMLIVMRMISMRIMSRI